MIRLFYFKDDINFVPGRGICLGCYNKCGGDLAIFHVYLEKLQQAISKPIDSSAESR
jgi:hypothetical protein